MEKADLLIGLNDLINRLQNDVSNAYRTQGFSFGNERYEKWKNQVRKFLDTNLPDEKIRFEKSIKFYGLVSVPNETEEQDFWRNHGNRVKAYIDSLLIDIQNDEYETPDTYETKTKKESSVMNNKKIFIVHGHDVAAKSEVARLIEKLGYEAIILHEQADAGKTIIEKIESYSDVGFAVVLYTECDLGRDKTAPPENEKFRARQNVVFEHGYLIAKLGRNRVCAFVKGNVETPGDISGVVYVPMDENDGWKIRFVNNMKAVGLVVDMNKI